MYSKLLILLITALSFSSCASTKYAWRETYEGSSSYCIPDPALNHKITILSQETSYRDGLLVTQTAIQNQTSEIISLDVQTLFKDQNGYTLDKSPMRTLQLPPKEMLNYVAHSPTLQVDRWIVWIKGN